jgi:hypothetical protein
MIQRGEDQEMAMARVGEVCGEEEGMPTPRSQGEGRSRMLNLSCQCQQTLRAALRDVIMSNVNWQPGPPG